MKTLNKITASITALLTIGVILYSCTDDSKDYLKYLEGGERLYIGKLDSLEVYSGHYRVQVQGNIPADPKAEEIRVYWNNFNDSIALPIEGNSQAGVFSTIIENLDENIYSFTARVFDSKGNTSVASTGTAEVFGQLYINSLNNRPIEGSLLVGTDLNDLTITFSQMDLSSGVLGSEITYTDTSGAQNTLFFDIEDLELHLTDYAVDTPIFYKTEYRPTETCIDTFFSEVTEFTPAPFEECYVQTQEGENMFGNPSFGGDFADSEALGFNKAWTNFDPKSSQNFCDIPEDTSGSLYLKGGCWPDGGVLLWNAGVPIQPNHTYQIKAMIKNETADDGAFNFVLPNGTWDLDDNDGSGFDQHLLSIPNGEGWVQYNQTVTAGPNAVGDFNFLFMSCDTNIQSSTANFIYLDNLEVFDLGL